MTEEAILLHLLRLPEVGPVGVRKILARLARIGASLNEIFNLTVDQLNFDLRLTPEQISRLYYSDVDAEEDLKQCAEQGIKVLRPLHAEYPRRQLDILGNRLPVLLFCQGNLDLFTDPALGVSGARKASEQSLSDITTLCEKIASEGWVIVSGGARGVDEAAHLAAVRCGPGTIIVLPTGVFKPRFRAEFTKHLTDGKVLIISEFPPEQGWTPGCAMQRNRLIAALSRGIVLVEPGMKGGTGGTGKLALKMHVPCYILADQGNENPAAKRFLENGARPLLTNDLDAAVIARNFNEYWEVSSAIRMRMQSQGLFECAF